MLRLDKVIKPWKESAALNDHINLYGFWNETTFLTKSGDVGMILSVPGVEEAWQCSRSTLIFLGISASRWNAESGFSTQKAVSVGVRGVIRKGTTPGRSRAWGGRSSKREMP